VQKKKKDKVDFYLVAIIDVPPFVWVSYILSLFKA